MSKTKNKVGERYGRLTVLSKTDRRNKSGNAIYVCQCDCGNIKEIPSNVLTLNGVKSCGCLLIEVMEQHKLHLEGMQFGDLYVIEQAPSNNNYTMWKCRCICGNEIIVRGNNLTYGNTTNCGCKRDKKVAKINYRNLIGQRFGKLVVIDETDRRSCGGNVIWKCLCDCGRETFVDTGSLRSGNTKSCGCMQSQGEMKIKEILEDNNITFCRQHSFDNCKAQHKLPFDFYVNNSYLIEYDGIHHFFATNGWNTEERLKLTQEHDEIKNNYCLENQIPLIRIPYTHYKDICLEDLMLNSTEFLFIKV